MAMKTSPRRRALASFSPADRSADASISARSAPAQKSFPAPRSTTTLTSASSPARSSCCRSCSTIGESIATIRSVDIETSWYRNLHPQQGG
jgi:hypothetical protein